MDLGCTVIDYEKMVDEKGRRVLYFGNYAGHAGMIDMLWTLGQRLEAEGVANPFTMLHPTHYYQSLVDAREAVGKLGWKLAKEGVPPALSPLVFGFFGYGHVSQGAQEIFDLLPVENVRPADIPKLFEDGGKVHRNLYKAVFHEEDMVRPIDAGKAFDLQDYYDHPQVLPAGHRGGPAVSHGPRQRDLLGPEIPQVRHQGLPEEALRRRPAEVPRHRRYHLRHQRLDRMPRSRPPTRRTRSMSSTRSRTRP